MHTNFHYISTFTYYIQTDIRKYFLLLPKNKSYFLVNLELVYFLNFFIADVDVLGHKENLRNMDFRILSITQNLELFQFSQILIIRKFVKIEIYINLLPIN